MKKILLAASCVAFLVACNNNKSEYESYYDAGGEADSTAGAHISAKSQQSDANTRVTEIGTDETIPQEAPADNTEAQTAAPAGTTTASTPPATETKQPATETKQTFEKGKKLIAKSDCLACHKVDGKLVGPAYNEVADKYEFNDKNVDYLAQKIIKGGSGVWGQIPMSPHPDMSKADAEEMAKYILSLNQ